jgi:hypothetical protein
MKNNFKNIAAAIMISGLFFVPAITSAQTGGGTGDEGVVPGNNNINIENPIQEEDKSQTKEEAEEELSNYALHTVLRNGGQAMKTSVPMVSDISLELQYRRTYLPSR